jgi:nicotinic acid mononucleotide adenylyltransferase
MKEQLSKFPSWYTDLSDFEKTKLIADRFYWAQAQAGHDHQSLKDSGWLNHAYSFEEMLKVQGSYFTPFEHYAGEKKEIFILLNTGSYAPAHLGHVSLLQKAKDKIVSLELSDNPVMVLSPSHDKYVLTKSHDIVQWNINKRMEKLSEVVHQYPYKKDDEVFLIDPWEAVYCEHPVNFTDVIIKYVKDLERLGITYKIGYVFGSDNEQFLNAFSELKKEDKQKFYAICVEREGYPLKINSSAENVIYVTSKDEFYGLKSRDIRRSEKKINREPGYQEFDVSLGYNKNGFYGVRNDGYLALKKWTESYPDKANQLESSFKEFHSGLKNILAKYTKAPVQTIDLDEQRKIVKNIGKELNCINLDIGTNDIENMNPLNLGRIFIPASLQNKPIKMIDRPESTTKFEDHDIPSGDYVFIDDDIASGTTLKLIGKILMKDGITFKKYINLAKEYCECNGIKYSLFDIVDTKDFLLGSYTGGLICEVHGKAIRIPYFAKYINLHTRASIEYTDIVQFNKEILKLNEEFFKQNLYLKLKDINKDLVNVMFKNINIEKPIYSLIEFI